MTSTSKRQSRPTVMISPESVVELSKSVLLSLDCSTLVGSEPGSQYGSFRPCGQTLNCWKAFYKHQVKHCTVQKDRVHYICRLTDCSRKLHKSLSSLKTHVELWHLKKTPLPCPFRTCVDVEGLATFSRSQDLVQHLEGVHRDLIGQTISLYSALFLPRWEPFPPSKSHIRPPPQLPPPTSSTVPPINYFVEPIQIISTPRLTRLFSGESSLLPAAHTSKHPPRCRMLQSSQAAPRDTSPPLPQSDNNGSRHDFADLPDTQFHWTKGPLTPPDILDPPNFVVQKIGAPQQRDLIRPLPQRSWGLVDSPPPPTSIFYDALRKQVLTQYAEGEGAAADD
ncbi:hypothetical protein B0H14DRAFT_1453366 [Mycena olivaceomarginata]|nr:hypothetical protein B0H14DRAFT_1453366 [Mycena olivaceomarginata]